MASIDGWTLEGTPLDGVVPIENRSELIALLHTIDIGAQTTYVTQRAADLLVACGRAGQALAVYDAWFALPEAVRGGAQERGLVRRRARLRQRLGLQPEPAATEPVAPAPAGEAGRPLAPPQRPIPDDSQAEPRAEQRASTARDRAGAVTGAVAATLTGAWTNMRSRVPPAADVAQRAGRARELFSSVATRRLEPRGTGEETPGAADAADHASGGADPAAHRSDDPTAEQTSIGTSGLGTTVTGTTDTGTTDTGTADAESTFTENAPAENAPSETVGPEKVSPSLAVAGRSAAEDAAPAQVPPATDDTVDDMLEEEAPGARRS